jgi:hypothetical protein
VVNVNELFPGRSMNDSLNIQSITGRVIVKVTMFGDPSNLQSTFEAFDKQLVRSRKSRMIFCSHDISIHERGMLSEGDFHEIDGCRIGQDMGNVELFMSGRWMTRKE